jgi:hypothetical protein
MSSLISPYYGNHTLPDFGYLPLASDPFLSVAFNIAIPIIIVCVVAIVGFWYMLVRKGDEK